tara:strand:- start:3701 stop:4240 length:540 start_codon:yes stop_codon:yes gene_type:complete
MEQSRLIGISGPPYHIQLSTNIQLWDIEKTNDSLTLTNTVHLYNFATKSIIGLYHFFMRLPLKKTGYKGVVVKHDGIYCCATFTPIYTTFMNQDYEQKTGHGFVTCHIDKWDLVSIYDGKPEDIYKGDGEIQFSEKLKSYDLHNFAFAFVRVSNWANTIYVSNENYIIMHTEEENQPNE